MHTLATFQPASWGSHLECISINRCALLKVHLWNLIFFLMHLSQSVVLWPGRGCIQKIALFGKRPCPYVKNSSNKQREMTVHHYFMTWRSVNTENVKNFDSAVAKTFKRYDETGSSEDHHRKRPRVTYAEEDKFIRVTSLRNYSPNKCFIEFKKNFNFSEETVWIRPSFNCIIIYLLNLTFI